MNINHFFILKIAAVLVFTGGAVFAAKDSAATTQAAASVAKSTKDVPLSDA